MLTCASHATRTILNTLTSVTPTAQGWIALCPCHQDHDPSLSISQDAQGRPLFYCHAGCSQSVLIDHFRASGAWPAHQSFSKNKLIRQILQESVPLWSSPAVVGRTYLSQRGLDVERLPRRLFFHPNLEYHEPETAVRQFPALVFPVLSKKGETRSVLRVFLSSQGEKAPVIAPKKALGTIIGNAIHFDRLERGDTTLAVCEGPETGLAIRQATDLPVWSAISASGLAALDLPRPVRTVHVFSDWDRNSVGQRKAATLAESLSREGRRVFVHIPDEPIEPKALSRDFLDVLVEDGEDEIARIVQSPLCSWTRVEPILAWLRRTRRERFSQREAQRALLETFPKTSLLEPVLRLLTACALLRKRMPDRASDTGPGRPPGPYFEVNPSAMK